MKGFFVFLFAMVFLSSASALTVSIHVPEKYQEVQGGDRLYFELTLKYPENPNRIDLRLEYNVFDSSGNLVTQAKGLRAIETQASFLEWVILPEDIDIGSYIISVDIKDYGELSQNVESGFDVSRNRVDILYLYVYGLSGAIVLMMIMIMIILFRRRK